MKDLRNPVKEQMVCLSVCGNLAGATICDIYKVRTEKRLFPSQCLNHQKAPGYRYILRHNIKCKWYLEYARIYLIQHFSLNWLSSYIPDKEEMALTVLTKDNSYWFIGSLTLKGAVVKCLNGA